MRAGIVLLILMTLFGCSSMRKPSDVVEVPDDVWQRAKQKVADKIKADQATGKTVESKDLETLNKALDGIRTRDPGTPLRKNNKAGN
jgi:hypothetical protein